MWKRRIWKPALLSALVLLVFSVTIFCKAQATIDAPIARLHVVSKTLDIGELLTCETHNVSFRIGNTGNRRLVINRDDCNCGQITQTQVVQPGNHVDLFVPIEPKGRSRQIKHVVKFTSNDPSHPKFELTVLARVDCL